MKFSFSIEDRLSPALMATFAESRASLNYAKSINYVMGMWLSFAMARIARAEPVAIEAWLMEKGRAGGRPRARVATSAKATKYAGTRAAAIVAVALRTKNARSTRAKWAVKGLGDRLAAVVSPQRAGVGKRLEKAAARKARVAAKKGEEIAAANEFYDIVDSFVKSSLKSGGYMRGGFIPALRKFHGREKGVARMSRPPGNATAAVSGNLSAQMSNAARAIGEKYPNVLREAEKDIGRWLEKMIAENIAERAKENGLQ